MKKASWIGLSLGAKTMDAGTDMIMIDGGEKKVYDMISVGWKRPIAKPSQTIGFTFEESSGLYVATIKRFLDTSDDKDFVMPKDAPFTIGWSLNSLNANTQQKHDKAGGMTVNFATTASTKVVKMGASFDEDSDDHDDHDDHDHEGHDHDSAMTASPLMATSIALVILSQF